MDALHALLEVTQETLGAIVISQKLREYQVTGEMLYDGQSCRYAGLLHHDRQRGLVMLYTEDTYLPLLGVRIKESQEEIQKEDIYTESINEVPLSVAHLIARYIRACSAERPGEIPIDWKVLTKEPLGDEMERRSIWLQSQHGQLHVFKGSKRIASFMGAMKSGKGRVFATMPSR